MEKEFKFQWNMSLEGDIKNKPWRETFFLDAFL